MTNDKFRTPSNRGAALLLVIFVLGALALLATPFLVAMVLQEKASRSYLNSAQARAAAVGARNFAVSQLLRTHEVRERAAGTPPFDDPYADVFDEVLVPVDTRRVPAARGPASVDLTAYFPQGVTNPQGALWGLEIEDEQAKLHRRSAPDAARTRLEAAVAAVAADPQHFFTEYSSRPAVWIAPQNIRAVQGNVIGLDDWRVYGKGARVRVTDGTRTVEGDVTLNHDGADLPLGGAIQLSTGLGGVDPTYAWIELEQRHAVNLNTARLETLQAVFEGLRLRRDQPPITRADAARIAERLVERPLLGDADFRRLLDEVRDLVSGDDKEKIAKMSAFAVNARIPTHLVLKHTEMRQRPNPADPNNPIRYEEWLDGEPGLGTVPAAWRTENTYLIEASGTMNTPAGSVAAESRFREVVSAAPAERLQWVIENQLDFEEHLHSDLFALMGNADYTRGYPYGHKVLTYPARPWLRTQALPYGESPDPKAGAAGAPGNPPRGLRPAPAKDRRTAARGNFPKVEHFTDEQSGAEGRLLAGPYQEPSNFQTFQIPQNQVDLLTGGVEFWFKTPPGGGDVFLFDMAEDEYVNRLACFVKGREIVLRACDASLERMASEIHAPVGLDPDTWYHLGAYWDSTALGGIALFLDGRPAAGPFAGGGAAAGFAHYDYANQNQGVRIIADLAQDIDLTQNEITIKNGGNFPPTGVIRIGSEAIDYNGFSGSAFRNCVRGARGTGPDPTQPLGLPHPADAKVTIYGYANPIASVPLTWGNAQIQLDRVTVGGATLAETLGPNTRTQINKPATNNPPTPGGITATDVTIPVTAGGTQNFPKQGYILIGSEVIFFSGTTAVAFTGCQRGQLGTTAAAHGDGAGVSLFGFRASTTQGYLNPAIIQIDDEWIAPVQPGPNNYFTGYVDPSGNPVGLQRGVVGTGVAAHGGGARIMPVFAVQNSWCGAEASPGRDVVTLVDRAGNKELGRLRVVRNRRPPNRNYNLVGLEDWVRREYVADGAFTRLLKFPSGELPSRVQPNFTIGGAQVGPSAGGGGGMVIDELRYHSVNRGSSVLFQPVGGAAGADTLSSDRGWVNSLPPDAGLVVMGDEVIAYRQRAQIDQNTGELQRCERGFLGTTAAVHDMGERIFHLGMVPVAVLSAPCGAGARSLSLQGNPRGLAPEGYVLVDNEVIGYTWHRGASLDMPWDRKDDGIFHGCFGTDPAMHRNDAIVVAMPFRYWDRYRARTADTQMTHFQAAKYARGAWWDGLTWTEQVRDPNTGIVVQARLDGKPYGWDAPKGIFEFVGRGGRGDGKLGVAADQIEVRVLFTWRKGSYYPANSWKRAPTFLRLAVDYEQPTMTLYHEER